MGLGQKFFFFFTLPLIVHRLLGRHSAHIFLINPLISFANNISYVVTTTYHISLADCLHKDFINYRID